MFKKILVPVDLSSPEPGARSCPKAAELSKLWNSEVMLLSVMPGYSMPMVSNYFPKTALEKMEKEFVQKLQELAGQHFSTSVDVAVRTGKRANEILTYADEWGADLIVFGCRPKDALGGQLHLGSCGVAVAERASCNVLVAR